MFEYHLFPTLLKMGEPILSYPSDAYWIDIGTLQKYLKAHHDLLLRWSDGGIRTEGESQIHPAAQIEGPVLIAEGCVIAENVKIKGPTILGPRCRIAQGAIIEGAVLWYGARVDKEAVLRNCVVGSRSHIQMGCHILEDCVLGDDTTVGSGNRLSPGTVLSPNSYIEPNTRQSPD